MKRTANVLQIIIRGLIIVIIIGVSLIIYQTCAGTPLVQKIDRTLPDALDVPYEVSTLTRVYQAQYAVLNDDGSVTMTDWYERVNGKWVYREGEFTLLPILKPRISRR